MQILRPSCALALVLCAAGAVQAQSAGFFPGKYSLEGEVTPGRIPTRVDLEVKQTSSGIEVVRSATRGTTLHTWRARSATAQQRTLRVTFRVALRGGLAGGLGGGSARANEFKCEYQLSEDGRALKEVVLNTTRIAPHGRWTRVESLGGRVLTGLTYGELAKATIPPLYAHLLSELGSFGPRTLPHEAKQLRKLIGKVRFHLDLFSYAYPQDPGRDPWKRIRRDLDQGYEAMGEFKDLYDAQGVSSPAQARYDANEVKTLRDKVLAWQAAFTQPSALRARETFLAAPKRRRLIERKKRELSPYFWGKAGIEPKRSKSGIENLARLQRALLAKAREDLADVLRVRDLHEYDNQEAFHDFRKRLRTAVKLAELLPEIFQPASNPAATLLLVDEAVGRFGDLNDVLVAYSLAKRRGRNSRAARLEDDIKDAWRDLRRWQDQQKVDRAIRDLRRLVLN